MFKTEFILLKKVDFLNLFEMRKMAKYVKKDILFLCLLCIPSLKIRQKSSAFF